jgi:hypothetical protein
MLMTVNIVSFLIWQVSGKVQTNNIAVQAANLDLFRMLHRDYHLALGRAPRGGDPCAS